MDLFSLTCTTCKSRLKVRDEAVIGQILACPKCGGMVMVKPPEGWQRGTRTLAPVAAAPLGKTAVVEARDADETQSDSQFDAVDDLLTDAPPKAPRYQIAKDGIDAPGLSRPRFVGTPLQAPPKAEASAEATGEESSLDDDEAAALDCRRSSTAKLRSEMSAMPSGLVGTITIQLEENTYDSVGNLNFLYV